MVGSAKEIAVAMEDLSRCVCGQIAKSKYVCESTDCNSEFCFQCMQKYIHGRTIIPYKLCESHYHSEIKCWGLDEELAEWESIVASTLRSIASNKRSIASNKALLESKNVKPALILLGLVLLGVGGINWGTEEAEILIGIGALAFLYGFAIMPITEASLKSTEASLKSNEATLVELISSIPDNNPSERPRLPEREIITITNESVKEYLVFI